MSASIYGQWGKYLPCVMNELADDLRAFHESHIRERGEGAYEHLLCRVKSEESMREKCRRQNLPETPESALLVIHDAIGLSNAQEIVRSMKGSIRVNYKNGRICFTVLLPTSKNDPVNA